MAEDDVALLLVAGYDTAVALRGVRAICCARSGRLRPHLMSAVQGMDQTPVVAEMIGVVERLAELKDDLFGEEASEVLNDWTSESECTPDVARHGEVGASGKAMADFAVNVVEGLVCGDCGENGIRCDPVHRRAGRDLSGGSISTKFGIPCSLGGLLLDPVSHVQAVQATSVVGSTSQRAVNGGKVTAN